MTYCEDAPCCGCCGTNIYGQYQGDQGYDSDPYDEYQHDDRDEYVDPADCKHDQGDYDDIDVLAGTVTCAYCETEGVSFSIMGEAVYRFPTTHDQTAYEGGEDRHLDGSYES